MVNEDSQWLSKHSPFWIHVLRCSIISQVSVKVSLFFNHISYFLWLPYNLFWLCGSMCKTCKIKKKKQASNQASTTNIQTRTQPNRCFLGQPLSNTKSFSARYGTSCLLLYRAIFCLDGLSLQGTLTCCHNRDFICSTPKLHLKNIFCDDPWPLALTLFSPLLP